MKKQTFILAFIILTTSIVHAQIALRPYVGINSHTLTRDFTDANWKSAIGYQVGADFQIGSKFFVQPGLQLEFAKNQVDSVNIGNIFDVKRTHFRVPVMVGYAFGNLDGNFSFRIFTGPNASIVLSESSSGFISKEDLKNAVFGWNAGAGIDISVFFIDLGYQFGLSEVFKNKVNNDSKDNLFYANAGVRLRF